MDNRTSGNSTGVEPPPDASWFLGVIVFLMVLCILCNSLIVVTFIVEKSIRNQANMFVVSLACSDLVVGMVSIPFWIANAALDAELHYYSYTVDILCGSASIFNCALLSIERALKISLPYWYINNVSSLRVKIAILCGWIGAVLVGGLSLARGTDRNNIPYIMFLTIVVYILPVMVIFVSYVSIFIVAHKHLRRIRKQKGRRPVETTRMNVSEWKTALRLSVFIVVYIICWTPLFIKIWRKVFLPDRLVGFEVVAATLPNINAAVNPFLYALLNPLFRKGMGKLYTRNKGAGRTLESSRRNELSTAQTNINNSPSTGRAVSAQCSPNTERFLLSMPANSRKDQLDVYETLLTSPDVNHEYTNNHCDNRNNNCLHETSL
ncbi:histamine H2 receptor-like [Dendronephthya gigantea]|uniref:histamine H2 receptor-like n=1 Tax=Dendronephthya gigantea TaxID=151771 RepID=UPI00106B04D2|nr:histamine H2 receptor-like [Dendronephthya gigantea]XP_028401741.1 histamine H2 receptor-like [Dendronephthya gigantea]XP_028401742.1 histamine H2 receptor-like [Dendronephthya gigantea]XP_028401743.1 histamine H2 receptor-like [Dendronephthya gigantea]XP_028401744.1 histamine H2 receptor-like [Dendronephthya gigantea]XP_028401745.1 histamine H2 receptor-like [Dendronephthya gigantea]